MNLDQIINTQIYPISGHEFLTRCSHTLDSHGVLALPNFINPQALEIMQNEGVANQDKAYFCAQDHTVYLSPVDNNLPSDHARNRVVVSSKGCICDDDVPEDSPLRVLYNSDVFRNFVKVVTGEDELHPYADPLSSINIHYAQYGQELGWHFDNSSFAITLLIEKPDAGSRFEYVKDLRNADSGDMNYAGVADLLDGKISPDVLTMEPGTLVLFRGRNSAHRVSPNESEKTRMLAVLAYNNAPGVELSENARMTFYGRLN